MEENRNDIEILKAMIKDNFEEQRKLIAKLETALEAVTSFNGKQMLDSRDMRLMLKVCDRTLIPALVKSHRKCLQMLNILTYIYTVKEVSLTLTLQEICEVLHMTPEEVEIQRQKGYIRFTTQKGMTVYEITDLLRLENMLEMGSIYRKIDKKVMNLEPLNNE